MINNVADLLEALIEREKVVLERQPDLNHAPMLGDMYEGLSRNILTRAVFKGLNLRVVEGKIRNSEGNLSGQMDCMVVEGEGQRLPYTDHFIYDAAKVIAIVEVKKTLYGAALAQSFLHLRDIQTLRTAPDKARASLIRDAWRSIMRTPLPTGDQIRNLSAEHEMIRTTLVLEGHQPVRIVLGYSGYRNEFELRKGLVRFLYSQVGDGSKSQRTAGFGINSFPNQIICGHASLLKIDGMPYGVPLLPDEFWPFLGSQSKKPIHTLLELLWTRLAYAYKLPPEIFGEDLEWQAVNPLIEAKWRDIGWEYRHIDLPADALVSADATISWSPAVVSQPEYVVLTLLCSGEQVSLGEPEFVKWLEKEGTTPDKLVSNLNEKHLAYARNGELHLLTDNCQCGILPSGEFFAGENKTGRLMRWIGRYMDKRKDGQM